QDGYDLGIGHHPFSASLGCARRGDKGIFCHLFFKFLAKIIRNTENLSNFTLGNHDEVFIF
ncbi:MAG: hypothetical protein K2J10_06525, partial [Muribaculaceae bacterium]|nr:hypothetical protein [Muribaculaceae bacterium]